MTGGLEIALDERGRRTFWRVSLAALALVIIAGLIDVGLPIAKANLLITSSRWRILGVSAGLVTGLTILAAIASWLPVGASITRWLDGKTTSLPWLKRVWLAGVVLSGLAFPVLLTLFCGREYLDQSYLFRLGLCILMAYICAGFIRLAYPQTNPVWVLAGAMIWVGVCHAVAMFKNDISTNPFTLGWSEGSRYYYASLFFSEKLYGQRFPLPLLHPTRYFLQSLPFLIDGLPIWVHRLWQVLLWIGMTGLTAQGLVQRLAPANRWWKAAVWGWAFIFLLQGPVYYHLLVCVIIVLFGFNPQRFWQTLITLVLASIWAGVSRINWTPVPAMMMLALYALETPYRNAGGFWRYWFKPAIWTGAGFISALGSYALYIHFSGNTNREAFGSSFTSDLIWQRLFPNATFPVGILPGILIISLPLFILALQKFRWQEWHPWRVTALVSILTVLLGGGIIVSLKIGGGSNLHNLDAFIVLFMVTGAYLAFDRYIPEVESARQTRLNWISLLLLVAVPLAWNLPGDYAIRTWNYEESMKEVRALERITNDALKNNGKILFIWQRQLLTFDILPNIPLEPKYETVELMEMVMSGNQAYLDEFYTDLKNKKYLLIIIDEQVGVIRTDDAAFDDENNLWVKRVTNPLLQSYWRMERLIFNHIDIYMPR